MPFTRVKPGLYRDDTTGIEIERQTKVLGGGRDLTEWIATGPARNGARSWITTAYTYRDARAVVEGSHHV